MVRQESTWNISIIIIKMEQTSSLQSLFLVCGWFSSFPRGAESCSVVFASMVWTCARLILSCLIVAAVTQPETLSMTFLIGPFIADTQASGFRRKSPYPFIPRW